jgi:YYY domain-containing protein
LGNLGTVKLIVEGMQRLAAQDAYTREIGFFTKLSWTFQGFGQMLRGIGLPFGIAEYYWQPSRVIPALNEPEPINEFPWFTTIYADLHAHFMALALVFLALAWAFSVVFSKAWKGASRWQIVWSFVFAGISIGVLRPTNTWDLPTYLALGVVAVIYAMMRYGSASKWLADRVPPVFARILQAGAAVVGLVGLTFLLYQPFAHWYGLPYSEISIWKGTHTPLSSYLVHWGLFLFILVFWMGWETRQWMAATPLSALNKLKPYRNWLWGGVALALVVMAGLMVFLRARIHLLAIPLAIWAALLLLRPGMQDSKRMVLFMVGTALFLSILVEVIVLSGDIGRMNTVFKFYLQAWVLFAVSSGAALSWTIGELRGWSVSWQSVWRIGLAMLVLGAVMFPLTATTAKIKDRMSEDAPHTLDGMAFMRTSEYPDEGGVVDLSEDYRAIRWMQENIQGTPVIVEANTPLYRWGSRFSIYTGLPSVLGWDWHQTQQRGFSPVSEIASRRDAIQLFYLMDDEQLAREFLRQYHVEYIVVGQLERNYYPGIGLDKFERLNGDMWQEVYRDGQTVIYKVSDSVTGLGESR